MFKRRPITSAISLNGTATLGVRHVSRLIFAFQDRHPDIAVDLGLTDERVDLVREGVDIALRLGPLADSSMKLRAIGETLPVSAPGQVLVSGILASGAPLSIHYRGGTARDGDGLLWEINGTEGDIRVSGPSGHTQMVQLSLKAGRGEEKALRPLEVPASYRSGWPEDVVSKNVARHYARMAWDLLDGTRTAPSFDDAVAVHRIIAAIERAAESGMKSPGIASPSAPAAT